MANPTPSDYGTCVGDYQFHDQSKLRDSGGAECSNGEAITTVNDSSGLGYNASGIAIKPVATHSVKDSFSAATFGGVYEWLSLPSSRDISKNVSELTCVCAMRLGSSTSYDSIINIPSNSSGKPRLNGYFFDTDKLSVSMTRLDSDTTGDRQGSSISESTWGIASWRADFANAKSSAYWNNAANLAESTVGTSGNTSNTSSHADPTIGANPNESFILKGDLLRLTIFTSITVAELERYVTDLGSYLGITVVNARIKPNVLTMTSSILAATATGESGATNVTVNPSVLAITAATQAATITGSASITPAALNVSTSSYSPTVSGAASVSPSVLSSTVATLAPTIRTDQVLSVSALNTSFSLLAPTVNISVSVSPSVLNLSTALNSPNVSGGASVSPSAQNVSTAVISPAVSGAAVVTPAAQNSTFSLPAASVVSDNVLSPAVLSAAWATHSVSVSSGNSVSVSASTLEVASAILAASVSADSNVDTSLLDLSLALLSPSLSTSAAVSVSSLAAAFAVLVPDIMAQQDHILAAEQFYSGAVAKKNATGIASVFAERLRSI